MPANAFPPIHGHLAKFSNGFITLQHALTWFFVITSMILSTSGIAAETAPWVTGAVKPVWSERSPKRIVNFDYDNSKSSLANGAELAGTMADLQPGDMLRIGRGRYSINRKFDIDLQGTIDDPIWIVGADPNNMPIITRPDARQNVTNVGSRSRTEYVCFRHVEFTGGSTLIRLYDCGQLWIHQCHLHHSGAEGITANSRDTDHLYITGNHLHHFTAAKATGEAMYLGANHGKAVMSYSVIADNHVHHCAGTQGDGIEVKQGSNHNWILRNHVHDTRYPCIIVYGTNGNGINLIERNRCYRSGDNLMQVQGEAIIRNNLLISAAGAGFASTDHQGKTRQIQFVHNTIIAERRGTNLTSWNNREKMVFANNVVYTNNGQSLRFPQGSGQVELAGNLIVGRTVGVDRGFMQGGGLGDFVDVTWNADRQNASFLPGSKLVGLASPQFATRRDINAEQRKDPPTAGAFRAP